MNRTTPIRIGQVLAIVAGLAVLATAIAAGASPGTDSRRLGGDDTGMGVVVAHDGSNSANAAALLDGAVGTTDDLSWANSGNQWQASSYPMSATVDLGRITTVTSLRFHTGQIPFPSSAQLRIEASLSDHDDSFEIVAEVGSPVYNRWSASVVPEERSGAGEVTARYIRLSFESMASRFNLSEVEIEGRPSDPGGTDGGGSPTGPGLGNRIAGVTVSDGENSQHAQRLLDRAAPPATDDAGSWLNPSPWRPADYPMTAVFDLDGQRSLSGLDYLVGNISQGSDRVIFEYSPEADGNEFLPLATVDSGHRWNNWRMVELAGQTARRVRISFNSPLERFNISEVRFYSTNPSVTTIPPTATTVPATTTTAPSTTAGPGTSTSTSSTTTTPQTATTQPATTTTGGPITVSGNQPQVGPPGSGVVRSHGFGNWPNGHLTQSCRDLHDSYWTQGPNAGLLDDPANNDPNHAENKAYHTWHPAVAVNADSGERCDFGHEHGFDPTLAPADLFALSGGWPAFGFVAETLAGARHEDHVGHKVTVANFRASIGNGAGSEPLYDAGFECHWLSKIHQGSSSLDAFANHLHEYFLTLRCMDGLNANGVVDNTVVGTNFSIKVMYTYGKPNEFAEDGCARDDPATPNVDETVFRASILAGPEGQHVHPAQRTDPLGNDKPNNRGFTCSSGVIWKDVSEIQSVDLWTQLIKIQRNDGSTAITVQPYYIVKNPSRIIEAYNPSAGEYPSKVVRTISLCYDEAGNRLNRGFCNGAPNQEPDWKSSQSPFNGALRALNFKASHLQNAGGPDRFCTDPFGFTVQDPLPCEPGNVMQKASQFDNHWNDGRYAYGGQTGNIQGSIWAKDPKGNRFAATPAGGGAYTPNGIGFEFIIDNRNPDDDRDGVPDGANLRGQN